MDVRERLLQAAAVCAAIGRTADNAGDDTLCDEMTRASSHLLVIVEQLSPEITLLVDWTIAEADAYVRSLPGVKS
jgi:hypothetical protein